MTRSALKFAKLNLAVLLEEALEDTRPDVARSQRGLLNSSGKGTYGLDSSQDRGALHSSLVCLYASRDRELTILWANKALFKLPYSSEFPNDHS